MPLLPEYLLPKAVHGIDITITTINGDEVPVASELQSLIIYESLDVHCTYGFLCLFDSTEMRETLPLVGQEKLDIRFSKINTDIHLKNLHVTNVEQSVDVGGLSIIKLHFTSYQHLANNIKYISRSFTGITSDIIEEVYKSSFGIEFDVIEKSNGAISYIAPNIRPFEVINTLIKETFDGDFSPMFFFKTIMSNKYQLRSLDSMRSNNSVTGFNDGPIANVSNPYGSQSDPRNVNKITQFSIEKFANINDMLKYGVVASKANHIDIGAKTYSHSHLSYQGKNISKNFTINDENPFESAYTRTLNTFANFKAYAGSITNLEGGESYSKLVYKSKFNERGVVALSANMYSNENLNVGSNIDVHIAAQTPKVSQGQKQQDEYADLNLSGKYLVHSIKHVIKPDDYTVQARLIKDYIL